MDREGESFQQTLERYRVLRDATIRLVNAAPAQDMKRTGTHAELGPIAQTMFCASWRDTTATTLRVSSACSETSGGQTP